MSKIPLSAKAQESPKRRKRRAAPPVLHVFDRRKIMARAWELAREARKDAGRRAYDLDVRVVGAKIIHNCPLSAHVAAIPLDLGTAQKRAWAEAKAGGSLHNEANPGALIVLRRGGALAPLRRMRFARVFRLMSVAARWIGSRFIPSRAA